MFGALGGFLSAALPVAGALFGGGGGSNPGNAAAPHLQRVPQYGYDAYNPHIETGRQAQQQLTPLYNSMANQPGNYLNDLMAQYQPSAGFQYRQDRNNRAAQSTAAAGGYVGTPNDVEARTSMVNSMTQDDMQQFLQNILGIQGAGIGGLQGRESRGFDASSRLADYLGGAELNNASNAAYGRAYGNESRGNVFNALGSLFTPGSIFGGSRQGVQ